jgi:LytS/YehU family sensor histidine kinase
MSALHPILARKGRLLPLLSTAIPIAALLTGLLARQGAFRFGEAVTLAWPLAFVAVFLFLSVWYVALAAPLRGGRILRTVVTHAVAAALICSVWVLSGAGAARLLVPLWGETFPGRYAAQVPVLFSTGILLYLLSLALHAVLLAVEATREAERHALQLQVLAREAELKALRAQMDPHFLFNALNSVSALVGTDPQGARKMCEQLAGFLRGSLELDRAERIPLSKEIALVHAFLQIERVRFGDRLKFVSEIDEAAASIEVPPLLLQPLVENALKHGIAHLVDGGTVTVQAKRRGGTVYLVVDNPIDPDRPSSRGLALGLENVRRRMQTTYGERALVVVDSKPQRFRVELRIPLEAEPA